MCRLRFALHANKYQDLLLDESECIEFADIRLSNHLSSIYRNHVLSHRHLKKKVSILS